MKNLYKTFIILFTVLLMSINSVAYAAEANALNTTNVMNAVNSSVTTKSDKNIYTPNSDGYYFWQVDTKTNISSVYGAWENGPEGRGPATLTMAETRTAINTITGSFTSVGQISAALGVSIGESISHYAGYSVAVPSYYTYKIIYRPRFYRYKVVQYQYYRIDGYSSRTGSTKTCYVDVFNDWGFDWVITQVY